MEASQFITRHAMEALSINFRVCFFFPKKKNQTPSVSFAAGLSCELKVSWFLPHFQQNKSNSCGPSYIPRVIMRTRQNTVCEITF